MLVAFAKGNTEVKDVVTEALQKLGVPITALFSTLGRTAARGLETRLVVHWMKGFYDDLLGSIKDGDVRTFTREWEPSTWPRSPKAWNERGSRGALAHWIQIKDKDRELPTRGTEHLNVAARCERPAIRPRRIAGGTH
jgi:hydrogenase large subunit